MQTERNESLKPFIFVRSLSLSLSLSPSLSATPPSSPFIIVHRKSRKQATNRTTFSPRKIQFSCRHLKKVPIMHAHFVCVHSLVSNRLVICYMFSEISNCFLSSNSCELSAFELFKVFLLCCSLAAC